MAEAHDLDVARIAASSEEDFRCSRCGGTFPTEGQLEADCPYCGNTCTLQSCRVFGGSKEGF